MDLSDRRKQMDELDEQLLELFDRRMRLSDEIARYKKENGLRVDDPVKERELLDRITESSAPDMAYYNRMLFLAMCEYSIDHQRMILHDESTLVEEIRRALSETPEAFPESAAVAVQGVQGAYSQQACDRFFRMPSILYMNTFRSVFTAIESGLCEYGVLPIENSTAGSVNQIYDLMQEYHFYIVRSMRVQISHCLLANPGAEKAGIREIFSHEQAIAQCEKYLQDFPDAKITVCENTAAAAKMVAESGRKDAAAIASGECGRLYGLECLEESVQDNDNNYTRFICITRDLRIFPGANRSSLLLVTGDAPGSLYRVLARFNAAGVNLRKLESRPVPKRDDVYMFYFDIEESVYSDAFIRMMSQIEEITRSFKYLGSYQEI